MIGDQKNRDLEEILEMSRAFEQEFEEGPENYSEYEESLDCASINNEENKDFDDFGDSSESSEIISKKAKHIDRLLKETKINKNENNTYNILKQKIDNPNATNLKRKRDAFLKSSRNQILFQVSDNTH